MSLRTFIVATCCVAAALSGCSKKSEAELAELERSKLREEKRQAAGKAYSDLAEKFPEHPRAKDAASKAQTLKAQTPKK
jgi:hypothetical protein